MEPEEIQSLKEFTAEIRSGVAKINKRMKALERIATGVDDVDDFDTLTDSQVRKIMNGTAGKRSRAGRELPSAQDNGDQLAAERRGLANFVRSGDREMGPQHIENTYREDIDPAGGYSVTPVLSDAMTKRIFDQSPIRRLAQSRYHHHRRYL